MISKADTYNFLTKINLYNFSDKSILIIGSGNIVNEYAKALKKLHISNVTIISKTSERAQILAEKFGFSYFIGGYENQMKILEEIKYDLVIIATPILELFPATQAILKSEHNKILIEKPGALFSADLDSLNKIITHQKVRIGYNRSVYPNLYKLLELVDLEGGISSCKFTVTERIHTINFSKQNHMVYERWGICNSLHVISMVVKMIGKFTELSSFRSGHLDWHPSGSIFVGAGISEKKIPFSYSGDWSGKGGWSIEIMTNKNSYRLLPLEKLEVLDNDLKTWKTISFECGFDDIKLGFAEELVLMLDDKKEEEIELMTINEAKYLILIGEKIFGYKK